MKRIKVGVLVCSVNLFCQFEEDNPIFDCWLIRETRDLEGILFDFYVRICDWERLPLSVLRVVDAQEKIRGLTPKRVHKEFPMFKDDRVDAFSYALFGPNMQIPVKAHRPTGFMFEDNSKLLNMPDGKVL